MTEAKLTKSKLLVSVRSADESRIACCSGADLIDVKEPLHGSLGAADPTVVAEVVAAVEGRRPVSVALGELIDLDEAVPQRLAAGIAYAKVGLAGCENWPEWREAWERLVREFPPTVRPVAVVYADWQQARAPRPEEVILQAKHLNCAAVLVDTYDKSSGGLTSILALPELIVLMEQIRTAAPLAVLAGSLDASVIRELLPVFPDYFAVRGAVCQGERTETIDGKLVQELSTLLADMSTPADAMMATRSSGLGIGD